MFDYQRDILTFLDKFDELKKKYPNLTFTNFCDIQRRRGERKARHRMFHNNMIAQGYKYKEKKGVYYYWKEKEK